MTTNNANNNEKTNGKESVQIRRAVLMYCRKDSTDKKALRTALEANNNSAVALLYPFAGKQTFSTMEAFTTALTQNINSALRIMKAYCY